jgi:hypothetical protein
MAESVIDVGGGDVEDTEQHALSNTRAYNGHADGRSLPVTRDFVVPNSTVLCF